jgi:hypothetical protein
MSAISDRYGRGGRRCIPEASAGQTRVAAHPSGDDWPTDNAVEELGTARRNSPNYWARLCVRRLWDKSDQTCLASADLCKTRWPEELSWLLNDCYKDAVVADIDNARFAKIP